MINYGALPLMHFGPDSRHIDLQNIEKEISRMNFEFLLSDVTNILKGDFDMNSDSDALMNITSNASRSGNLFYCQFFSIMNAYHGYYTDRKDVDSYELRYTLSGSGKLEYRGKSYHLHKGDGFFISSKEHHRYYANAEGWKCTVFHFNGSACQDYFNAYAARGSVKFSDLQFTAFETLQYQVLRATQHIVPYMNHRISCLIDLLLTELLTAVSGENDASKNTDDIIQNVIEHIHSHYAEKIVFENLAKEVGLSRSSLFASFKKYTGYSPGDYLNDVRLRQAQLMLLTTSLTIQEISLRCGFSDSGHFSQIFKKYTGITPLKYRKGQS